MAVSAIDVVGAVLAGVYGLLNVSAITSLGYGVYDDVPQEAPRKYLVISSPSSNPDPLETFGKAADDVDVQVSVFSDYRGAKEPLQVRSVAVGLVHGQTFSVPGGTVLAIRRGLAGQAATEDADGVPVRHFWVMFRVSVQQA